MKGWQIVLQTLWISKFLSNFTGLAISFFSGYVHLAVSIFSQSCLAVLILTKAKRVSQNHRLCLIFYQCHLNDLETK